MSEYAEGQRALRDAAREERLARYKATEGKLRKLVEAGKIRVRWLNLWCVRVTLATGGPSFDLWPSTGRFREVGRRALHRPVRGVGWEDFVVALGAEEEEEDR